jgi:hypothetical protein
MKQEEAQVSAIFLDSQTSNPAGCFPSRHYQPGKFTARGVCFYFWPMGWPWPGPSTRGR